MMSITSSEDDVGITVVNVSMSVVPSDSEDQSSAAPALHSTLAESADPLSLAVMDRGTPCPGTNRWGMTRDWMIGGSRSSPGMLNPRGIGTSLQICGVGTYSMTAS